MPGRIRRSLVVEELESKILHSADLNPLATDLTQQNVPPTSENYSHSQQDVSISQIAEQQITSVTRNEIVFIDSGVNGWEQIASGIASQSNSNVMIFTLNANEDGITQISEVLKNYNNLDAIH